MAANGALDARRELIDKWDRRHRQASDSGRIAEVLEQNLHLLPETGSDALDLACGRGANAILLAQQGMRVRAWDFSPEAIAVVERAAREAGVELIAECRDVIDQPPRPATFDIIVVSFFLERCLVSPIVQALRPAGLLFYQSFARDAVSAMGPSNPEYRLGAGELLELFRSLRPRVYRDEGRLGDPRRGCRDIAMLVAEKPA